MTSNTTSGNLSCIRQRALFVYPASLMWETWVQSLGWEDLLEKKRLPTPVFWPREFQGLYSPWGHRVGHNWENFTPFSINNNPLLCGTLGLPTVPSCGPNGDLPTVTVGWHQANLSSLQVFPKLELRTKIQLCFGGFFMFLFYIGRIVD